MPQTIALQRGTTTVSGDGSSAVTLWTQSDGLATRVIVNQLCMSFGSTASNVAGFAAVLYLQSSGGQASVLGKLESTNEGGGFASQWGVGASNANGFGGTGGGSPNTEVKSASPLVRQAGTAGDMLASNASSVTVNYSVGNVIRAGNLPSNFYIGPNDQLRMKVLAQRNQGKGNFPLTATISYSFTTITET